MDREGGREKERVGWNKRGRERGGGGRKEEEEQEEYEEEKKRREEEKEKKKVASMQEDLDRANARLAEQREQVRS